MMSLENVRKNGSKVCTAMCHLLAKATCMGIDISVYLSLWSCEVLLLRWLQVKFCECEFRLCKAPAYQKCEQNSCVPGPSSTQNGMAQVNPPWGTWADSSSTQYMGCHSFTIMESYFYGFCSCLLFIIDSFLNLQNDEENINSSNVFLLICADSTFLITINFPHCLSAIRFRSCLRSERNAHSWTYIHTHCGSQIIGKCGHYDIWESRHNRNNVFSFSVPC